MLSSPDARFDFILLSSAAKIKCDRLVENEKERNKKERSLTKYPKRRTIFVDPAITQWTFKLKFIHLAQTVSHISYQDRESAHEKYFNNTTENVDQIQWHYFWKVYLFCYLSVNCKQLQ